jgi:pyrroline-5-carboxylate reductase
MKMGFIGVGTIAEAMIVGLCEAQTKTSIVLCPRNAATVARLKNRFPHLEVALTNQAVLDSCDLIILSVRPQVASEVLAALGFRPAHHVISLIAAVSLEYLGTATAPAGAVTRAVPLPAVARRQGPTAIYPPHPEATALFDLLGTAVALDNEDAFSTFTTVTAIMASYFALANTVTSWMVRNGVGTESAQAYVGEVLRGLAGTRPSEDAPGFAALEAAHRTSGGLNEQLLRHLTEEKVFDAVTSGLDAVENRLRAAL